MIQQMNTYFVSEIKQILSAAQQKAYLSVNSAMVEAYWLIGKRIVEEEQQGKERAAYGEEIIKTLSVELTKEFGKGYSITNLKNFRRFYILFSECKIGQAPPDLFKTAISQAVPDLSADNRLALLSWTHYERLIRIENKEERDWYMKEAAQQSWSYRTLDRNISTLYYRRLLSSQIKEPVVQEMTEKTKGFQQDKFEFIKNPAVLEFLGLPNNAGYTESLLEQAIINDMQKFLLELGKGFAFVDRQQLIRTETQDFYIDLVFYNYIIKCFVIVELKTQKITHQDVGQLDMYVRMYDDLKRGEGDNPTIGILLCTETDKTIARYSVLNENKQLFASKYMLYLPTEEELVAEIERQKVLLKWKEK